MKEKDIEILSFNVLGQAELIVSDHQSVKTAFCKVPVKDSHLELGLEGIAGDMVQNKKHHGGNDKALCCYNADHFQKWENDLGVNLKPSAFGENLTLTGESGLEENVFIGDRYELGNSIVEVSEPRGPCYVIGIRYNKIEFPIHLQKTGFTGFYLRTIKSGSISTADKLVHLSSHPARISILDVNHIRYHDKKNKEWLEKLVNLQELTFEWRDRFQKLLHKL